MPTVLAQSIASTDPNLEHVSARLGRKPRLVCVVTISMSTKFFEGQLAYLAEHGFDVTMISSPGPELEILAADGIATCAIPMEREISPLRDIRSLWALWRSFRKLRPDIVNAGTPKAGLLGTIAARLAGVPCVVYTLRGLRLETTLGAKRGLLTFMEWTACRLAHSVRCVSPSVRKAVIDLGISQPVKTCVVGNGTSNGIDIARFAPESRGREETQQLRSSLGIPAEARVVGFVGRFTRDKGVEELYQAFLGLKSDHPDLRLLMVGDFESGDPVRADLRAAINSDPGVIQTGFIRDVAPYYAIMDVLAFPSYREGFPGVPLEAQAAEVTVVASDATGAVDCVIDGVTGFVVPVRDADRLQIAIRKLLDDPDLRRRMGRAGTEWVAQDFRRDLVWKALLANYSHLLQKRNLGKQRASTLVKPVLDRAVASVLLLVTSPVWALAAILIRYRLGSPVLFKQARPGLRGKPFMLYKFRTMNNARSADGDLLPDEQRLTRLGKMLRACSIDEIPQLWNVVKGEMSLVGPRPLLTRYMDRYTPEQARRHDVLPGITGWAQVNGRNAIDWQQKFQYDIWYVDHWSLWLDFKILLLTAWKVLGRAGISNSNHATMPEFMGDSCNPACISASQQEIK
jgi:lipopolysaccharide/colanic/teichoic acid biosynthesis glycosyltransferase